MTDNDLIQFAAEKVGGEPYIKDAMPPAVLLPLRVGPKTIYNSPVPMQLSDWVLFGRGLSACPHELTFFRQASVMSAFYYVRVRNFADRNRQEEFANNVDLPKAFWTAWYHLEHDET